MTALVSLSEAIRPDPSGWRPRLSETDICAFRLSGLWGCETIADRLDHLVEANNTAFSFIDPSAVTLSAIDLRGLALRLCQALSKLGLKPGEVVSFQLPNWYEAAIVELACAYGGFICNPIVSIYRAAEVAFILNDCGARVLFVPDSFRQFDFRLMAEEIQAKVATLAHIVTVRPQTPNEHGFEYLVSREPVLKPVFKPDANHIKLLMYTSGTTSAPKGVLHTHNTIGAEIINVINWLRLEATDVILMPSPVGHITGYLYGIQLPITLGCKVVLMETWDAARAADLIEKHGVTFTLGATPFLRELSQFSASSGRRLPTLRCFPTGGAPVPPEVIYAADRAFERCVAFRIYGSTEAPTITLGVPDRDQSAHRATTEGRIVGHEVRIVDNAGHIVPRGTEGEITTRGPELCVGYLNTQQTSEAFDESGYFHTGDLGVHTSDGNLVITGRKKDVIIRGGENISPKEIEDALCEHPAVLDAAVIAMPHVRLGETPCAYVTLRDTGHFDLAAMTRLLTEKGLARQKFPQRLVIVPQLPYTPAGKVKKNILRDELKKLLNE